MESEKLTTRDQNNQNIFWDCFPKRNDPRQPFDYNLVTSVKKYTIGLWTVTAKAEMNTRGLTKSSLHIGDTVLFSTQLRNCTGYVYKELSRFCHTV